MTPLEKSIFRNWNQPAADRSYPISADAGRDSGPASDLLLNQKAATQTFVPGTTLLAKSIVADI